jgi:hemerythrin
LAKNSLTKAINSLELKRNQKKEIYHSLADYFDDHFNFDEEISRSMGLTKEELEQLRREYES